MRSLYPIRNGLLCAAIALSRPMLLAQQPLTLPDAVATALGGNPDRQIARASVENAQVGARLARTALLPSVSFSEAIIRGNDPVTFLEAGSVSRASPKATLPSTA